MSNMQLAAPEKGDLMATLRTNMGDITFKLFPEKAPKTVENFTTHVKDGYYNGIIFHRVIKDFMIQGGDPTGTGCGGESIWGKPFKDEFCLELRNYRGALSMANAGPGTNGSQFFIVQCPAVSSGLVSQMRELADRGYPDECTDNYERIGGTPHLDFHHTVFGQVTEGMEVVDAIANVETGYADKPVEDVVILSGEVFIYGE